MASFTFLPGMKNSFLNSPGRNEVLTFIIAFSAAFLLFPVFFDLPVYPLSATANNTDSLDPSWKLLLNKTNLDHGIWGKDLTITYGPFGFLTSRMGWGINKYSLLLFDLFTFFNFLYIFYRISLRTHSKILACLLILAVLICLPVHYGPGNALVLLAFLLFWIRESLGKPKLFFYGMQLCLILVLFFMKFNTGLATFVFFLAGLGYNFFVIKKNRILLCMYGLAPFLLVLVFSGILNVDLAAYIKGGLQMVSGYNGIMYLDQDFNMEFWVAVLLSALILLLFVWNLYVEKEQRAMHLVVIFLLFSSVYILYKQAFVRNDIHHVLDFYKYLLLFILCCYDFQARQNQRNASLLLICILLITIFVGKAKKDDFLNFKLRINKARYLHDFSGFTKTSGLHLFPGNNPIPGRIRTRIGTKSADVYPWNIQLLIENKINYKQRPVPQSYTAYTPYLEDLNFEFYNSAQAPDFVFYEFDAIDMRYPLFDEPKLNLVMLKKYTCVDTFSLYKRRVLLLEKKDTKPIRFEKIKEFDFSLDDTLVPTPDSYYEVQLTNSLKGKCYSFLRHGPELSLRIKTKDGQEHFYKTSTGLLETGIFCTYFFNSTFDFKQALDTDSLGPANEVSSYSFHAADPSMVNRAMRITEYKLRTN